MADEKETQTNSVDELLSRDIPINYYGNEDVTGVFADQVVVSHLGGMFTLYFYQMQTPITPPPDQGILQHRKVMEIESVSARCVARLVLTPTLMEQFQKAIETNMGRYKRLVELQAHEVEE